MNLTCCFATTSGLPPPTPEPPHLLEATSQSLRLSWRPRTPPPNQGSSQAGEEQDPEAIKVRSPRRGVRHILEMLDTQMKQQQQQPKQQTQQRFKQVYEGEALEYLVEGLRRSSLYRFRLAAGNSDGLSAWCDPVAFRTAPDNPSAPRSLRVCFIRLRKLTIRQVRHYKPPPIYHCGISGIRKTEWMGADDLIRRNQLMARKLSVRSAYLCTHIRTPLLRLTERHLEFLSDHDDDDDYDDEEEEEDEDDDDDSHNDVEEDEDEEEEGGGEGGGANVEVYSTNLRGRVRPYQVNLCWLLPDDDGGLPVQAYRLEVQLAHFPTSAVIRQFRTSTHDPLSAKVPADTEVGQTTQVPICWPWVIAPADDSTFASRPPSSLVLQTPSVALAGLSLTKQSVLRSVPSNPQLPRRVTSSAKAVNDRCGSSAAGVDCGVRGGGADGEDTFSFTDSSLSGSDSEGDQQQPGQPELVWYSIYEGRAREVAVCNLTPGLTLQFRVRATSDRLEGSPVKRTEAAPLPRKISWGPASPCPLKLTIPAVPPMNPPANIRPYGRPRPNGLRITWDPPASNGGAPIVSYELWQSVSDPLSGSPLKSPVRSNLRTHPSSESMCNLAISPATIAVTTVVSAPTTAVSSPVHKLHSSGRGPHPTGSHAPASAGQLVYSGPEADCWVGGLRAGQAYGFRARAKNATGWSGWSAWQTLSTAASPPQEPTVPPRVLPLSATSVAVTWDPVVRVNGAEITEYRVEWQSVAPGGEVATNSAAEGVLAEAEETDLGGEGFDTDCGPRNPSPSRTSHSKSSVGQCTSFQLVSLLFTFPDL
ncbi:unnamed protein product [Schistocephalus solidus]|uniref:Fibronectin type-III domain-containing protein n=1 Tax=Schistocephalus solidus TaxID=70667 RepID=A0A183SQM7_SCHSO|nr:unnamed protein product [Schistocephalus solidus]